MGYEGLLVVGAEHHQGVFRFDVRHPSNLLKAV
jgi:hypothetical protein